MNTDRENTEHPIYSPFARFLETPAAATLHQDLTQWLWLGQTGGVISGPARAGKTTALRRVAQQLRTRDARSVPVIRLSVRRRDKRTIATLLQELCFCVERRAINQDLSSILAERFIHYVADLAAETESDRVCLFVDEMQRLAPIQFDLFADLYDDLIEKRIALMTVFVGDSHESTELIESMNKPSYTHTRGRFFKQQRPFRGLTSEKEVRHCLAQYDQLRFPEDGPTFTEYFLPEAVKDGWTLASLSGDLWRVFRDYRDGLKLDSWCLTYFVATVTSLLDGYLPTYGVEAFDEAMANRCIEASGLIPSSVRPV